MSRFNTGNQLGSGDPRDLDDNAKNMDLAANSEDSQWIDRFGRPRLPLMEQERQFIASQERHEDEFQSSQESRSDRFNDFIASSGYQFAGDYAPGIEITEYNQLIRDSDGEFWRVSGQVELPYVTTGAGIPEDDALVPAGDAVLRQDLANPDKGAAMVAGAILYVDSIDDMLNLPTDLIDQGRRIVVNNRLPGNKFSCEYVADRDTTSVDGFGDHLSANGNIAYRLQPSQDGTYHVKMFGADYDVVCHDSLQAAINYVGDRKGVLLGGGADNPYLISKGLRVSARHSGLTWDMGNSWLKHIPDPSLTFPPTHLVLIGNGIYESGSYVYSGDAPGRIEVNIPRMRIQSSYDVEGLFESVLDSPLLLPENGGNSSAYSSAFASAESQISGPDADYRVGGMSVGSFYGTPESWDPAADTVQVDIGVVEFVNLPRNGLAIYNNATVEVSVLKARGVFFHPVSTTVVTDLQSNPGSKVKVGIGRLVAHNCGTAFDFSSSVKGDLMPHGTISVREVEATAIRHRTKIHGNYDNVRIEKLSMDQRMGGVDGFFPWPAVDMIESLLVEIGTVKIGTVTGAYASALLRAAKKGYPSRMILGEITVTHRPGGLPVIGGGEASKPHRTAITADVIDSSSSGAQGAVVLGVDVDYAGLIRLNGGGGVVGATTGVVVEARFANVGTVDLRDLSFGGSASSVFFNVVHAPSIRVDEVSIETSGNTGVILYSNKAGAELVVGNLVVRGGSIRAFARATGSETGPATYVRVGSADAEVVFTSKIDASSASYPVIQWWPAHVNGVPVYQWYDGSAVRYNRDRPTSLTDGDVV